MPTCLCEKAKGLATNNDGFLDPDNLFYLQCDNCGDYFCVSCGTVQSREDYEGAADRKCLDCYADKVGIENMDLLLQHLYRNLVQLRGPLPKSATSSNNSRPSHSTPQI